MMQAEETVPQEQPASIKKKRGLMSRFRFPKRSTKSKADKREGTPSPPPAISTRDESPQKAAAVVTPTNDIPPRPKQRKSRLSERREIPIDSAPSAREAAFGGPPRYDWIDIETAAAIKVQSAFRRNKTLRELEKEGVSTAAIRNAQRRRKAQQRNARIGNADIPNIFQCCGVGLAFGDATEDTYEAARLYEKEQYEERKKAKEQREEELRQNYLKVQRSKKTSVEEVYEVIEEEEDDEGDDE